MSPPTPPTATNVSSSPNRFFNNFSNMLFEMFLSQCFCNSIVIASGWTWSRVVAFTSRCKKKSKPQQRTLRRTWCVWVALERNYCLPFYCFVTVLSLSIQCNVLIWEQYLLNPVAQFPQADFSHTATRVTVIIKVRISEEMSAKQDKLCIISELKSTYLLMTWFLTLPSSC